jgi:hypothetical protein
MRILHLSREQIFFIDNQKIGQYLSPPPPIQYFRNTVPLKPTALLKVKIYFFVFLILSVYSENTREVFKSIRRIRQIWDCTQIHI